MIANNLKLQVEKALRVADVDCQVTVSESDAGIIIFCNGQKIVEFDLTVRHYSFLGYQKLARFVYACWHEPEQISDLLAFHGLCLPRSFGGYAYWTASHLALCCNQGHPILNWKVGDVITIKKPLFQSLERHQGADKGFRIKISLAWIKPFDSENYLVGIPPNNKFRIAEIETKSAQIEDYGGIYQGLTVVGTGESVGGN